MPDWLFIAFGCVGWVLIVCILLFLLLGVWTTVHDVIISFVNSKFAAWLWVECTSNYFWAVFTLDI